VRPGDLLFGDDDGVVAATEEIFAGLIPRAEKIRQQEEQLLKGMAAGRSLLEMLNFDEHCAKIRAGAESALEFRI